MAALTRPSVIAFDCYRTLVQNDPRDWERMFGEICRRQRLPVSGAELWDKWKAFEVKFRANRRSGSDPKNSPPFKSYRVAWAECFSQVFAGLGVKADAAATSAMCIDLMASRDPFPETLRALGDLASRARLAILSNADDDFLGPCIRSLGVEFVAVVSSESAGWYKPSPAAFDTLLKKLGVAPAQVWFVGDHLHEDVHGSSEAGMTAVWVNRPGGAAYYAGQVGLRSGSQTEPDAEVADLSEIAGLFDAAPIGPSRSGV